MNKTKRRGIKISNSKQPKKIIELLKTTATDRQIAEQLKISKQYVRQLAKQYGLKRRNEMTVTLQPKVTLDDTIFSVKIPKHDIQE